MHVHVDRLHLSPSDVTASLACEHLTTLSLRHALVEIERPEVVNEQAELIFRKGLEHEHAYLETLCAEGKTITEIEFDGRDWEAAQAQTVAAMRSAADGAYEGVFASDRRPAPVYPSHSAAGVTRNSPIGTPCPPTSRRLVGACFAANAAVPGRLSLRPPLLHLDRCHRPSAPHNEVDLAVPLAPVEELARPAREMRADRGVDESAAVLRVLLRLLVRTATHGAHQRCVEDEQFRARAASTQLRPGELLEPGQHAGAAEQLEVVGERGRVPRVLELPQHLREREDLAGVAAAELEELPE